MPNIHSAIEDFFAARRQAALEEIIGRLTGKSTRLLAYDEVREKLRAGAAEECGLQEIPISAIIGSVGRYGDFTRSFLPLQDKDKQRWLRVNMAINDMAGTPPIEVYQIGKAYFVRDGNHRVSVARHLGATHIQALVTEVQTRVPLSPDDSPDELILKGEFASFLEDTRLDEVRPAANLKLTVPGQYRALADQIQVHRHFMTMDGQPEVSTAEAAAHWYDTDFWPCVQVIRRRNVLKGFPGRTEADLYLWIAEHRAALEQSLGWEVQLEAATADWARHSPLGLKDMVARAGQRLGLGSVTPGHWRQEQLPPEKCGCLFADILVSVNGDGQSWQALDQAVTVISCEQAQLLGLYVAASRAEADSEVPRAVRAEFERRCRTARVPAQFAVDVGQEVPTLCKRARWSDLVVAPLPRPPGPGTLAHLAPAFQDLVRHCVSPILAVPAAPTPLDRSLLAYDGSPTSKEALFVATYLAAQWAMSLVVVAVDDDLEAAARVTEEAQHYLDKYGVSATLVAQDGPVADAILRAASEHNANLIIVGGDNSSLVHWPASGRVMDRILRSSLHPVLICR